MSTTESDFNIFRSIFYYTAIIVTLPLLTFFVTKNVLFDYIFGANNVSSNVSSAIAAVVILHLAVAVYIYKAYKEDSPSRKPEKID